MYAKMVWLRYGLMCVTLGSEEDDVSHMSHITIPELLVFPGEIINIVLCHTSRVYSLHDDECYHVSYMQTPLGGTPVLQSSSTRYSTTSGSRQSTVYSSSFCMSYLHISFRC